MKKFKQSTTSYRLKKKKKLNRLFDKLADFYNQQYELNNQMLSILEKEENGDKVLDVEDNKEELASEEPVKTVILPEPDIEEPIVEMPLPESKDIELEDALEKSAYDIEKVLEEQIYLREDLEGLRVKLLRYETMESYLQLNERIVSAITDMDVLIDSFNNELQDQNIIPDSLEIIEDSTSIVMDRILFELLEIESIRGNFTYEVETKEVQDMDDKFNFGFSISNIGPKIDFVDVDQADPSPTNMRIGIYAQLYYDGYNGLGWRWLCWWI